MALNIPVKPTADRLTLAEAAELIRHDYPANGHKSVDTWSFRWRISWRTSARIRGWARITTGAVEAYKAARLAEPVCRTETTAAGTTRIPTETRTPRRSTARAASRPDGGAGKASVRGRRPVRGDEAQGTECAGGVFRSGAFQAVCRRLRPELAALATVAKLTGWRKSELRSRQWRHVDFAAGWLRLEPEETKNRDGRMFPLIPELRVVLEAQRARVEALQKATGQVIPWVFCRDDGAPVGDFKKAWATARIKAGVPGRLFHDFRRTAVRNLIRAGIPETVAMKMTGHRTRSVFQRYAIVEETMLNEAAAKLIAAAPRLGTTAREPGRVVSLERSS